MYERRFLAIISTKKGPSGVVYCVPVWKQSVITCPVCTGVTHLPALPSWGIVMYVRQDDGKKFFGVIFLGGINKKK